MKRIIVVIVLAVLAGYVVADLARGDDSGTTSTPTTSAPRERETTTTTVDDTDYEMVATCLEASASITEGLTAIADGAELLPYVSNAEAREFLATSREFVETSIQTIQLCGEFAPVEAAELLSALRQLDSALASAETLY